MKTIGRIVMILLAAAIVIGATWAVAQRSGDSTFTHGERPEFTSREGRPAPLDGEFGERESDHHAAQVFSLRGWLSFGQTLIPLTIIIAVITLPMHLWKKRQRARRNEASVLPA